MTETRSAYEQANDFVNNIEDAFVLKLLAELEYWEKHGPKCGCPQCLKRTDTYTDLLYDEIQRLEPSREYVVYKGPKLVTAKPHTDYYDTYDEEDT